MKQQQIKIREIERIWLTTSEAAQYLGTKPSFLHNLRREGKLHYYKINKLIFFRKADIDRLIASGKIV